MEPAVHLRLDPLRRVHQACVTPVRVCRDGTRAPSPKAAAGPCWERTGPGLYRPAGTPDSPEQRIVEAAALLPAYGGVTGWAGLRWLGGYWFGGTDRVGTSIPVPLACTHRRKHPSLEVCEEQLAPGELIELDGVPVTTPVRSVTWLMRRAASLEEAVQALDMAAYNDLVSIEEARDWIYAHPAWTGIQQARDALPLAGENAWSPAEVSMRLNWTRTVPEATLLTNRAVFTTTGRLVGTPDLLDPVHGVAGEYDGGLHLTGTRRAADIRKEAALRELGLEVVTMVAADAPAPEAFAGRLRAAYGRAARSRADRMWNLTPPPWWADTTSVAARRALTPRQRERALRYRSEVGTGP